MQAFASVEAAFAGAGMQQAAPCTASIRCCHTLCHWRVSAVGLRSTARFHAPCRSSRFPLHIERLVSESRSFRRPLRVEAKVKWVFEPIGDGDTSHLDAPIALPGAFALESDVVTVGRIGEKVDIAIPVPTVSGLHARLEKKGETLHVTDLDSTNGTFVDGKRLRPGAVTVTLPNSSIIFGDEHLASYQVFLREEEPLEGDDALPPLGSVLEE